MRSTGGAAITREELVEVMGRLRDPRRIRFWHLGHWIVSRDGDIGQDSLQAMPIIVDMRL